MAAGFLHRHPAGSRDPNLPKIPMGESKNEVLYIVVGIVILALIALSFWFQASR